MGWHKKDKNVFSSCIWRWQKRIWRCRKKQSLNKRSCIATGDTATTDLFQQHCWEAVPPSPLQHLQSVFFSFGYFFYHSLLSLFFFIVLLNTHSLENWTPLILILWSWREKRRMNLSYALFLGGAED